MHCYQRKEETAELKTLKTHTCAIIYRQNSTNRTDNPEKWIVTKPIWFKG